MTGRGTAPADLLSAEVGKTLLLFALPTLGANLLQTLNGTLSLMWIGRLLGPEALGAALNVHILLFVLSAFVFGIGMAAMILIGQEMGRGDRDAARRAFGASLGLFVLAAVSAAAAAWALAPELLRILGLTGETAALALPYLRTILISTPGAFVMLLIMMALRATGDAVTPLRFTALLVLADALLNPLFIAGAGPLPALGIAGSGVSTVAATYLSLLCLVAFSYRRRWALCLRGAELRYLAPDPRIAQLLVRKGVPIGLQMIVAAAAALATLALVNRHGSTVTAAYGAVAQLWTYIQMPAMALAAAVSAMAAQAVGAGRRERLGEVARAGVLLGAAVTATLVLLSTWGSALAVGLFLPADSPVFAEARHIHLIGGWGFVLLAGTTALSGVLRSSGSVVAPLLISIVAMFPIRLGGAVMLEPFLGKDAIWWSFPIGFAAALGLTCLYYRFGSWRSRQMLNPATV